MKLIHKTLALAAMTLAAGTASAAGSATGNLTTTWDVLAGCQVNGSTAGATTFGDQENDLGEITQSGTLLNAGTAGSTGDASSYIVSCGSGVTYTLGFDEGANEAAGSLPASPLRRLAYTPASGPVNYIAYNLFNGATIVNDAAFTNSDGAGGTTGTGATHVVTSKITDTAASNTKLAGTYTDTVIATLSVTP